MERFAYDFLIGKENADVVGGVVWFLASNLHQPLGPDLLSILNRLGSEGWEVVGVGDVAFTFRVEIILKKRLS